MFATTRGRPRSVKMGKTDTTQKCKHWGSRKLQQAFSLTKYLILCPTVPMTFNGIGGGNWSYHTMMLMWIKYMFVRLEKSVGAAGILIFKLQPILSLMGAT
ncbi:hypothetical protein C1H46_020935 [Malus baccata]|uniref:Uncharacterized protein n=1 Tax=Malus baccata TaxID=106549 RepID=A0A540M3Z2_MALBA|nr:hypothetical protein C1H46_020935 [Malus baccata]